MAVINIEQAGSRWNKSCFLSKQKEYQKNCDKQQVRKGRQGITRLARSIHYCHSEFSLILETVCSYTLSSIDLVSTRSRRFVPIVNSSSNSHRTSHKESVSDRTLVLGSQVVYHIGQCVSIIKNNHKIRLIHVCLHLQRL